MVVGSHYYYDSLAEVHDVHGYAVVVRDDHDVDHNGDHGRNDRIHGAGHRNAHRNVTAVHGYAAVHDYAVVRNC